MKFDRFLSLYRDVPVVESSTFDALADRPGLLRSQVSVWQHKGYLHRLKRGVYVLDERFRRTPANPLYVANYLVSPSYLSLEYALAHYFLIPESVRWYTSVTPNKTRSFTNVLGHFAYRSVKESLFFGYEPVETDRQEVLIACPEKALLDFFYLNSASLGATQGHLDALRLQNLESLNVRLLKEYAARFPLKVQRLASAVARTLLEAGLP